MKTLWFYPAIFSLIMLNPDLSGQNFEILEDYKGVKEVSEASGIKSPVTLEVIYDNYVSKKGTTADWGFSVLIAGLDKMILFDTGTKPEIFESNFHASGIDPAGINMLVISHEHTDHTGGIASLVKMKTGIPVLMPESFSAGFKEHLTGLGLIPVMVNAPSIICRHLYSSGEFEFEIPEEALVLDTRKGLVVITGCAHPGIINMLSRIKHDFGKNIYMVCGGLHLMDKTDKEIDEIIYEMKGLGVIKCGATHCTGEKQIKMFREAFGADYVEFGTGNKIVIN